MVGKQNPARNVDLAVVEDFGNEVRAYDQSALSDAQILRAFRQYFDIFPFDALPVDATGFDMGCGSGRWARFVAPRVRHLTCIDASTQALAVAGRALRDADNVSLVQASVDTVPIAPETQDFGYSLGVLHHIPDTGKGIEACARLLKPGAPFLLYLYYDFENKPLLYRALWRLSELIRRPVSRLPFAAKKRVCAVLALVVYLPLARLAWLAERLGLDVTHFPLSDYRGKSFYFMRTDALDRFGTKLEKRFSRADIADMLEVAGMTRITFSENTPYWVCLSYKG